MPDPMLVPTAEGPVRGVAGGVRSWKGVPYASAARFAPAGPPATRRGYDALGPTHGADNACLWAHIPNFISRPLLGRPAGPMRDADIAVTDRLQDAVCAVVNGKDPDWPAWDGRHRPFATFGEP